MPTRAEHERSTGARPANEANPAQAAEHVRALVNSIAPRYDLLNHLISMGLDRHWWTKTARAFQPILQDPQAKILDLCCGTGDQTIALLRARPSTTIGCPGWGGGSGLSDPGPAANSIQPAPITGLDFSPEMLARARQKYPNANIRWVEGDAMHLPFADNTFDLVTAAFGFRNLTDYAAGLLEIHRVLRPGGQIGILEANQPEGAKALIYNTYFRHIAPLIGGLISGDRAAYRYLPDSVARFPRPPRMLAMLTEAGFTHPAWDGYLLHSAGLYRATKI
jgi:demethylmenaquinone methyltransferase/2-methoxy-6-polyprenyl-1,4-benzoquinol methylase